VGKTNLKEKLYHLTGAIVTYNNNEDDLSKAINSFLDSNLKVKLYIYDNSPINKIKLLCNDERIEYIFSESNIGFGAGHNKIIEKVKEDSNYHLVLNPDVKFDGSIFEELLDYMEKNGKVGLIMPKILNSDGSIQYLPKLIPSPLSIIKRKLAVSSKLRKTFLNKYELRKWDVETPVFVPIISGCFSLFRTSVFEEIKGYDENFFMYFEDFDISRRISRNWDTIYYPYVSIIHNYERGASKSKKLFKIFIGSCFYYFNKWGWLFDPERKRLNKRTLCQFLR